MRKIILLILLLLISSVAIAWYSMQSLPNWIDDSKSQAQSNAEQLSEQIRKTGITKFLGSKVSDVMKGQVSFDEMEFNAILLASLKNDDDGRKLLSVSDAVRAFIRDDHIEITAIINLAKLEKVEPKARKAVEKLDLLFPFLNNSRVALTVYATPVARGNKLAIKDDFHIKVGAIPISNSSLKALGVKVERANNSELAIKYLALKSVRLASKKITLEVSPRF